MGGQDRQRRVRAGCDRAAAGSDANGDRSWLRSPRPSSAATHSPRSGRRRALLAAAAPGTAAARSHARPPRTRSLGLSWPPGPRFTHTIKEPMSVSVVIPAFDAEAYLAEAIESVLAQTAMADEVLVVDDGSADATSDIARSFGDPVRCIRQARGGPGAAMNQG